MGTTETLRRLWLFSANKIKTSESVSKQSTQLQVLNSSSNQLIVGAEISHIDVLFVTIKPQQKQYDELKGRIKKKRWIKSWQRYHESRDLCESYAETAWGLSCRVTIALTLIMKKTPFRFISNFDISFYSWVLLKSKSRRFNQQNWRVMATYIFRQKWARQA